MIENQRVWAEINLDDIASNVIELKKIVPPNTEIMGIVKADAYGHGATEVSKTALYNGVTSLGVATSDEGVSLRENSIFVPILILGYTPEHKLVDVILKNLTQTVFSLEMAQTISNISKKLNKVAEIHLKIDTGMSRLGFMPNDETINEIEKILKLENINVTGIYSHFATSDRLDKSFANIQFDKFQNFLKTLSDKKINFPCVHISNSGAILDMKNCSLDTVRAGIILYGLSPSDDTSFKNYNLKPAMSLKTQISYLKTLEKGISVGYGRTFYTNKVTKVATVPVGYADGYTRAMSNIGEVIVNGQFAPIIGNICMDQFMIDVTDIKNVKANDEVVLFGRQGDCEITIDEVARLQNTINYEIVCNIGKRVPRIYMKNGILIKTLNYI